MTGTVEQLEHPLLLLSLGVPCWVVSEIFGHNDMFWHRHLERLGRNSLVGTTVRDLDKLPQHLVADEHHADWCGQKGYVAFTAGAGCVLGVALTDAADESHLTEAYGKFADESRQVHPEYAPETVNTDGWWATSNAFSALFEGIVTILCFLHGFLKVRDRCRKAHELHRQVWDVYRAATAAEFRERMATFREWFEQGTWPAAVQEMVAKLWKRASQYVVSYDHPRRSSHQQSGRPIDEPPDPPAICRPRTSRPPTQQRIASARLDLATELSPFRSSQRPPANLPKSSPPAQSKAIPPTLAA
jgi:hypothetical protein